MVKFDGFRQGELKRSDFRGVDLGAWDRRDGMVVAAEALKAIEAIDTWWCVGTVYGGLAGLGVREDDRETHPVSHVRNT